MAKLSAFLFVAFLCFTRSDSNSIEPLNSVEEFGLHTEQNCALQGGYCLYESDCPKESQTVVKGLCPMQQNKGVECCYEMPPDMRNCKGRGGECVSDSECMGIRDVRSKCPSNQHVCCIYVR